ncbi:hypothetical protein F511_00495 [Dorcoceras hygrometricum]|uniref:MADS-box domain-containing protein n=1 Tax=Dorcoceras hygrometricum TaxID=472368 RepID=A0A2Z7BI82_9LAMI|nr:hypothetical protein F511_00495 [Dorcoceras hygrometricum]
MAEGRRQTRGRQRIPMQLIQNQDDLYATFSKRRLGIYKKATELCTLCDVDIGIILFSPTDVPYSFFHPRMESVVSRSMNPQQPQSDYDRIIDSHARGRVDAMNRELDRIIADREAERVRFQQAMDEIKTRTIWMRQSLDTLTKEQALMWRAWFVEFRDRVNHLIEKMKNEASGSGMPQQEAGQNVEGMVVPPPQGDFYYPGVQTPNDPHFGGGASSSHYYFPAPPPEGQNLFPQPFILPSQELNLGPPGSDPSYNPYYVPPMAPDFPAAGGGDVPGEFYIPFQPYDFSTAGFSGQFYPPPPLFDPAAGGASNQDEAGPSNQNDDDAN